MQGHTYSKEDSGCQGAFRENASGLDSGEAASLCDRGTFRALAPYK